MSIRAGVPRRRAERQAPLAEGTARSSRQSWLLLVACVAQFMVILDLTIVNVALPSIQADLGFSAINLQWVVDAYAIAFAGFLMLGGRFADQFGARRTLSVALALFALTSLAGGSAISQFMLVSARTVQGLSGALMAAASLAAITSAFPPGPGRHRAIGLWGAMNGAGGAAGALFGGIITQEFGWRWVLLINPPIGIAAAVAAFVVITDQRKDSAGARFDFGGALSLTGGLMLLVYGIVNASAVGWTAPLALIPIVAGVALLAMFPAIETRLASAPLVPPGAFTRPLRIANLIVLLFSATLFPMWYVSSLYLQQVLGLSPLDAGLAFFPMALMVVLSAGQAHRLIGRFGVRAVLTTGLCLLTSGMLIFTRIGPSGSALGFVVLPGLLVAAGIGLSVVPSTIAATQLAGASNAGLASGLVNTSRQVGGSLGIAVLISMATQYTSHLIGQNQAVSQALTSGFRLAYFIGAALAAAAAVVAGVLLPPAHDHAGRPLRARLRLPLGAAVLIAAFVLVDATAAGAPAAPIGAYTTRGAYTFVSAPGLHPPKLDTDTATEKSELAPGYILLTNFYDLTQHPMIGQSGPLIVDNDLNPVWFRPVPVSEVASDLALQTYQGKPALSWWQGTITNTGATESGEYVVVNQHYQTIATLKGADGWVLTLHSLVIDGQDAWVTANKNVPMNLTRYGGAANGAIVDSAVQEYNLKTGRLVRSWDAYRHLPLADSYANPPVNGFPWDVYHVNSISLAGNGKLLVSMRNTWAAYLINPATGKIDWTLGGKHSSFAIPSDATFEWQHDVTMPSPSTVSMFNDNCCQITGAGTYLAPAGPSRAMVLKLSPAARTVRLVASYQHGGESAAYMGSTQVLPNGNVFVGWGDLPYFTEFTRSGRKVLDGVLPGPDLSYRAKQVATWVGLPLYPPSGAVRRAHGVPTVYASWNGATRVRSWRVLGGQDPGNLAPIATALKSGFETAIAVRSGYHAYEVQALDARGHVLGTSRVFTGS
ncbi:MAG: MFS transporter [Streptosporangiaceae bacterium]